MVAYFRTIQPDFAANGQYHDRIKSPHALIYEKKSIGKYKTCESNLFLHLSSPFSSLTFHPSCLDHHDVLEEKWNSKSWLVY